MRYIIGMLLLLGLTACDDFTPREKAPVFDPQQNAIVYPFPCPDWSQNSTVNYDNSLHSNFGCAVNNNTALQLENPADLHRGHGSAGADTETTSRVIERYRAGEIPTPLEPQEDIAQ